MRFALFCDFTQHRLRVTDVSEQPFGLETVVTKYHSALCNMPQERRSHLHCDRSLKSRSLRNISCFSVQMKH